MKNTALLLSLFFYSCLLSAQVITMINPGFEGRPGIGTLPPSWEDCSNPGETPPDTYPVTRSQMHVKPYGGTTFMGMVARDDGTSETTSAYLSDVLKKDHCYRFKIALCSSPAFLGISRQSRSRVTFNAPVRLRIWGGDGRCAQTELLAVSPIIDHEDWQEYTFLLQPTVTNYAVVTLQVDYGTDDPVFFTNGNLLLDEASAFVMLPDGGKAEYGVTATTDLKTMVIVNQGESAVIMEDDATYLKLPAAAYFQGTKPLRGFLSNVFNDIAFSEKGALVIEEYFVYGEQEFFIGYPALHACVYALLAYPQLNFELVVFDKDREREQEKVEALSVALRDATVTTCNVRSYSADQDDGRNWFCMSIRNGLYLLQR